MSSSFDSGSTEAAAQRSPVSVSAVDSVDLRDVGADALVACPDNAHSTKTLDS
jgi:hypothetical protein